MLFRETANKIISAFFRNHRNVWIWRNGGKSSMDTGHNFKECARKPFLIVVLSTILCFTVCSSQYVTHMILRRWILHVFLMIHMFQKNFSFILYISFITLKLKLMFLVSFTVNVVSSAARLYVD